MVTIIPQDDAVVPVLERHAIRPDYAYRTILPESCDDPKSDTGQINEALCKVLAHNICVLIHAMHALNVHPIFSSEIQPEPKKTVLGN